MSVHLLPLHLPVSLLLCAPLVAQAPEPSPWRADTCRIEVLHGRAQVLSVEEGKLDLQDGERRDLAGRAHLEIPIGSEVRLSWIDRASLDLHGPTAIEWGVRRAGRPQGPLPSAAPVDLEWILYEVAWIDLEIRRGEHVLRLPGDWRVDLGHGAVHLIGLPHGPIELRNGAGTPAILRWLGDPSQARPPIAVLPGSTLRIDQPPPAPSSSQSGLREPEATASWPQAEWPWRGERDTPADRREREELGRRTDHFEGFPSLDPSEGPATSIRPFTDEEDLLARIFEAGPEKRPEGEIGEGPESTPEALGSSSPSPTPLSPLTGRIAEQRPRPESEPPRAQEPPAGEEDPVPSDLTSPAERSQRAALSKPALPDRDIETTSLDRGEAQAPSDPAEPLPTAKPLSVSEPVQEGSTPFDASLWRGLRRDQLSTPESIAVERRADIEVRVLSSGRIKVLVDALSSAGGWCFGPEQDWHLEPGAVLVFDTDGSLLAGFGDFTSHSPLPGRPSPITLGQDEEH